MNDQLQAATPLDGDDERSLLLRLERMLAREEELIATRDAAGLSVLAAERSQVAEQVIRVARTRSPGVDPSLDAELIAIYERLRRRHEVQAQIVRCHAERTTRAINVLAQAGGQQDLYNADGRVRLQFAPT